MIRGIDFYQDCFDSIRASAHIDIRYGEVSLRQGTASSPSSLLLDGEPLEWEGQPLIFSSIPFPYTRKPGEYLLLQHFKGWVVQTRDPVFDASTATLMDFDLSQQHGTTFAYWLPLSPTRALVEYTVFSESLLDETRYEQGLRDLMNSRFGGIAYQVIESEFGVIPMTNHQFPPYKDGIYYIGTAGGQTKASTGYTFQFIQRQSDHIIHTLLQGKIPDREKRKPDRFHFYDSTLLHILSRDKMEGRQIFTRLFQRNPASRIFRFLDNQTSLWQELRLLNTLPKWVFLKAGMAELGRLIFNRKKS
ncbi:MAG: lycopene cyclase [Bacteroidota bacterium]|nr:lycopene cyclase [Bacteroidota bacterium]